jgi:cyclohexanecarboxylate-CoA ligase
MSTSCGLLDRIAARAKDSPRTTLRFIDPTGSVTERTLGEFVSGATSVADGLSALGLRPGDTVAVRGRNGSLEFCQAVVGAATAGMVAAPLVSFLGDADVEQILDLARVRALVSQRCTERRDVSGHLVRLAGSRPGLTVVDLNGEAQPLPRCVRLPGVPPGPLAPADDRATAFLLFTSGTTSAPKGVRHSRASILAEVLDFAGQLDLHGAGHLLQPFPIGHVGGVAGLFLALALGRETTFLSRWDPAVALDVIDTYAVTSMGSTPYFAQTLFDERDRRGHGLESLRVMESGGGRVGSELVFRAARYGVALSRGYGSTEHPTVTTHRPTDPVQQRASTDGRPTNGSEVQIVDEVMHSRPACVDGEVLIRGPEQFLGYLGGDGRDLLDGGWFRTGDIGHLTGDGQLCITGRIKEIVIRGGENISVPEVEAVLASCPGVREAAVIGVPDPSYGERVYAFVARTAEAPEVSLEAVRRHFLAAGVARYKTPEWVEEIGALPRNALGKVQKHLLEPRLTELGPRGSLGEGLGQQIAGRIRGRRRHGRPHRRADRRGRLPHGGLGQAPRVAYPVRGSARCAHRA